MACYHPLSAYQADDGSVTFKPTPHLRRELTLPCGQCVGCRLERSRQWALRCVHEAQMHPRNSYVTLTYSNDELPEDGGLRYKDYQLFMKRLRKWHDGQVRFYMCGEYGEKTQRPHYHALLFGVSFPDQKFFTRSGGHNLYTSDKLDELWSHGHTNIGEVTFESASYVARYVMKKITGPPAEEHYTRVHPVTGEWVKVTPEFNRMSLGGRQKNGGIGMTWLKRFKSDVYTQDGVVHKGKTMKAPRYYDKWLSETDSDRFEELEYERFQKAQDFLDDNTPERLAVREQVAKAGLTFKKRNLE